MSDFSLSSAEAVVVCAVKSTLNIATAAHSLGMPKTTLSSILSKLEKKLGNQIFIRKQGSGSITVTEYGHQIIPKLEKILWISESLKPRNEDKDTRYNAGKVALMSTQTILEGFLCPYLADFLDENPEMRVTLSQIDDLYYFGQSKPHEVFIGCWKDNTENYLYIPFHHFKQRLWASKEYLERYGAITCLEDLRTKRLILHRGILDTDEVVYNDFVLKQLGISSSQIDVLNVTGPRIFDVLAENGVGIIASSEETTRLSNLDVVPILPEISGEAVHIFVKVDRKFIETPLARYMVDWIFACRDAALLKIGVKPQTVYKPFF